MVTNVASNWTQTNGTMNDIRTFQKFVLDGKHKYVLEWQAYTMTCIYKELLKMTVLL